jgi:hypothetical protein
MFSGAKCYHAPELVFRIDGIDYFAADAHGVGDFSGDIVLNLSGHQRTVSLEKIPAELAEHIVVPYKEVMIPWQDGGIPYVKTSFWKIIHEYIRNNNYKSVCIHCEAGHGRTGTALASLAIANLAWSVDKAVKFIRAGVCRHMVETSDQCNYLMALDYELNGREIKEEDFPNPSMIAMFEEYYTQRQNNEQNGFVDFDMEKGREELEEEDEELRRRKEE